jgi:hypothetical protein
MLTDKQQNQVKDILRLIPADERAAFLDMLEHELRGRELHDGELRRVAEHTWRKFLRHGWQIHGPGDAA